MLLLASVCASAHTRPHYGGTLRVETQADPWQAADSIGRRTGLRFADARRWFGRGGAGACGAMEVAEWGPSLAVLAAAGGAFS